MFNKLHPILFVLLENNLAIKSTTIRQKCLLEVGTGHFINRLKVMLFLFFCSCDSSKIKRYLGGYYKKTILSFFMLIFAYCLSLTTVFIISQKTVEPNLTKSIEMINKETFYSSLNKENLNTTKLDHSADFLMMQKSTKKLTTRP